MMAIEEEIKALAQKYAEKLSTAIDLRMSEMTADDRSHLMIYRVLGVTEQEGKQIDLYQNRGRFLYKSAGSFLEDAVRCCFCAKFPGAGAIRIPNKDSKRPKNYEIDCLVEGQAIEIKWRDATTDGDHQIKERARLQAVVKAGYRPVRLMFFYPNRQQAQRIQRTLETEYLGVGGEYHAGEGAWSFVKAQTGVDLRAILERLSHSGDQV